MNALVVEAEKRLTVHRKWVERHLDIINQYYNQILMLRGQEIEG
jgi:hypothetical protein